MRRLIPKFVNICEVSARDGLQYEKNVLTVEQRATYIDKLSECNFKKIEVGSFVSETWVPQMKDTGNVSCKIHKKMSTNYIGLVPNMRGYEQFTKSKCDEIAVFTSVSEGFTKKNTNKTVRESMEQIRKIVYYALNECIPVRAYISTIIHCPYEGKQSKEDVMKMCKELLEIGCYEVSLGETIGQGTPGETYELMQYLIKHVDMSKLAVHFHDTYGYALENIYIALKHGVKVVDSSVGGLGGCPYAKGASGNVSTEKVLGLLNNLEIQHNIREEKVNDAREYIYNLLEK
jgi:hydroxymethylglutaryl-CoA lyase